MNRVERLALQLSFLACACLVFYASWLGMYYVIAAPDPVALARYAVEDLAGAAWAYASTFGAFVLLADLAGSARPSRVRIESDIRRALMRRRRRLNLALHDERAIQQEEELARRELGADA